MALIERNTKRRYGDSEGTVLAQNATWLNIALLTG